MSHVTVHSSTQVKVQIILLQVPCAVHESEGQRFQEQASVDGTHPQEESRES